MIDSMLTAEQLFKNGSGDLFKRYVEKLEQHVFSGYSQGKVVEMRALQHEILHSSLSEPEIHSREVEIMRMVPEMDITLKDTLMITFAALNRIFPKNSDGQMVHSVTDMIGNGIDLRTYYELGSRKQGDPSVAFWEYGEAGELAIFPEAVFDLTLNPGLLLVDTLVACAEAKNHMNGWPVRKEDVKYTPEVMEAVKKLLDGFKESSIVVLIDSGTYCDQVLLKLEEASFPKEA